MCMDRPRNCCHWVQVGKEKRRGSSQIKKVASACGASRHHSSAAQPSEDVARKTGGWHAALHTFRHQVGLTPSSSSSSTFGPVRDESARESNVFMEDSSSNIKDAQVALMDTIKQLTAAKKWALCVELVNELVRLQRNHIQKQDSYNNAKMKVVGEISLCKRKEGVKPQGKELRLVDVVVMNAALSACAKSGRWQASVELLRKMENDDDIAPNGRSYTTCMHALARKRKWHEALQMLKKMLNEGKESVKPTIVTFNVAISACEKAGRWSNALEILELMRASSKKTITCNETSAHKRSDRGQQLGVRTGGMKNHDVEPDVISYNAAISACEKAQKWQEAEKLFQEMLSSASDSVAVEPNVITYNALLSAYEKGHQWEKALKVLHSMMLVSSSDKSETPARAECGGKNETNVGGKKETNVEHVGQRMVIVWPDAGEEENCGQTTSKRKHGRCGLKSVVTPDIISFSAAISACEKANKWEHALKLFEILNQRSICPDAVVFNACISACGNGGKWTEATELYRIMTSEYHLEPTAVTYCAVLIACARAFF